jgi:hypothetical protein
MLSGAEDGGWLGRRVTNVDGGQLLEACGVAGMQFDPHLASHAMRLDDPSDNQKTRLSRWIYRA